MFLERVCKTLGKHKIPFAIVGGHAVALHGAVRGTVDIDFVIRWTQANLQQTEQALTELGLTSRLPISADDVFRNREDYIEQRNRIDWNFYNSNSQDEQLDLIINYDLGSLVPVIFNLEGTEIPVLDIDSLIAMKMKSGRPQDLADVDALERIRQ